MAGLNLQGVALPAYAREDLAWDDVISKGGVAGVNNVTAKIPGDWLFYPTSLTCSLATDATVANRSLAYRITDGDGGQVLSTTPPTTQPASSAYTYSASINTGTAYGPIANAVVFTMPPFLLLSTYSIGFLGSNIFAGDIITWTIVGIKIPTGPPIGLGGPSVASPIIVAGR